MSVLVHLCRGCGHQSAWHEGANGGYTDSVRVGVTVTEFNGNTDYDTGRTLSPSD